MMKQQIWTIALAIVVIGFGFAVFVEAGRPMRQDSPALREWATAYCERDYDKLYAMTFVPEHVERDEFASLAAQYADQQQIRSGCYAEVVVHQARNTAVPAALRELILAARYFPEVDFYIDPTRRRVLGFTTVMTQSGEWLVYAPFITPTQEYRTEIGHTETLIDQDGLPVGYAMVREEATVLPAEAGHLLGVPLTVQTLGDPWMNYRIQLFTDRAAAVPVIFRDQLPGDYQSGFLAPNGGSVGQNLTLDAFVWFVVDDLDSALTLSVTAVTEAWDVSPTHYFTVTPPDVLPEPGDDMPGFSPFADVQLVDTTGGEMSFEVTFDTEDMPRDDIALACNSFVLQIGEEWHTPGFCDFKPDVGTLFLVPDERVTAAIWYTIGDLPDETDAAPRLVYRMIENYSLQVFDLWQGR